LLERLTRAREAAYAEDLIVEAAAVRDALGCGTS
jgi:hypothetical protein